MTANHLLERVAIDRPSRRPAPYGLRPKGLRPEISFCLYSPRPFDVLEHFAYRTAAPGDSHWIVEQDPRPSPRLQKHESAPVCALHSLTVQPAGTGGGRGGGAWYCPASAPAWNTRKISFAHRAMRDHTLDPKTQRILSMPIGSRVYPPWRFPGAESTERSPGFRTDPGFRPDWFFVPDRWKTDGEGVVSVRRPSPAPPWEYPRPHSNRPVDFDVVTIWVWESRQ